MRHKLNLGDGIHPNAEGVSVIVDGIVPKVEELIARVEARRAGNKVVESECSHAPIVHGLELPESVRVRLGLIRVPLPGARWVEPEDFHITLRFAGDIDNRIADEFAGFLDDIEMEPFDIRFPGLVFLAGARRA